MNPSKSIQIRLRDRINNPFRSPFEWSFRWFLLCWDGFPQALLGRSGQGHGSVVEAWSGRGEWNSRKMTKGHIWRHLMMVDDGWWWLMMVDGGWWWLIRKSIAIMMAFEVLCWLCTWKNNFIGSDRCVLDVYFLIKILKHRWSHHNVRKAMSQTTQMDWWPQYVSIPAIKNVILGHPIALTTLLSTESSNKTMFQAQLWSSARWDQNMFNGEYPAVTQPVENHHCITGWWWLEHDFYKLIFFHSVGNVIIPTDEL